MSLEGDEPSSTGPQRATFVLRLVRERRRDSTWRGEVEYVQRGERRIAADPSSALAHVTAWLDPGGAENRARDSTELFDPKGGTA